MNKKESEQIHEAAKVLRQVLEKYIGGKAMVFYGATYERETAVHTGITLSDKMDSQGVEHLAFTLIARARDMIDYQDETT